MMHYYLYEIRNNINGKIYIGVHKTKDLNDGYMGSGKISTLAIAKYGIENFTKTILETFETQEEMFAREKEIVTEEFLSREDTYNLRRGGLGGFDHLNDGSSLHIERTKLGRVRTNEVLLKKYGEDFLTILAKLASDAAQSPESKKKFKATRLKNGIKTFLGKSHTEETKTIIAVKNAINQQGEKNSQFGSIWITNGKENKKIKKTDPIPEDWFKGRILKIDNATVA